METELKYQCYHCGGPIRVIFTQAYIVSSKKKEKKTKNTSVPICCTVCAGRIARKIPSR